MADDDNKEIERSLGQIIGQLNAMQTNFTDNLRVIRDDIRRSEDNNKKSMEHLEERINVRIDKTDARVLSLEKAEKETIASTAKHSAIAATGGSLLTVAVVELIKRFH